MPSFPDSQTFSILQIRSSLTAGSPKQVECQVGTLNGKRLSLVSSQRVATGTTVSMEYNDTLLLGEVIACTQSCDEKWHIELKLEQVLTGLQSLMVLRQRLLCESESSRVNAVTVGAMQA